MNKLTTFVLLVLVGFSSCSPKPAPAIPQDKEIEKKIEKLLSRMTLEEKIGQMTQVTATILVDGKQELTPEAEVLLRKYKVGSVLNPPVRVGTPPAEVSAFVKRINDILIDETGIPCLYGLDHIHGTSFILGGVLFPQQINLAATFNRELAFADYYGRWTIEEGDFALSCGDQNVMVRCTETVVYDIPNID